MINKSYAFILFIEKVAFNSHALVQHSHGDDDEHGHGHGHDDGHSHGLEDKKHSHDKSMQDKINTINDSKTDTMIPLMKKDPAPQATDDEEDEQEETIKNVVSGRGHLASFLLTRNTINSIRNRKSMIDNNIVTSKNVRMSIAKDVTLSNSFANNRALVK